MANYKNAWALRRVAEEYIACHLAVDLEIFEFLSSALYSDAKPKDKQAKRDPSSLD